MTSTPKNVHTWARDPNDWYVEPEWCSEALFAAETFTDPIVDPCAGTGRIVQAARRAGYEALAFDLIERQMLGVVSKRDYFRTVLPECTIVSNPPFSRAREFVERGLLFGHDMALFLPLPFIAGDRRSRWMEETPLAAVAILAPRPSCPPGAVVMAGESSGGGTGDFAWFIWRQRHVGPWAGRWIRRP